MSTCETIYREFTEGSRKSHHCYEDERREWYVAWKFSCNTMAESWPVFPQGKAAFRKNSLKKKKKHQSMILSVCEDKARPPCWRVVLTCYGLDVCLLQIYMLKSRLCRRRVFTWQCHKDSTLMNGSLAYSTNLVDPAASFSCEKTRNVTFKAGRSPHQVSYLPPAARETKIFWQSHPSDLRKI